MENDIRRRESLSQRILGAMADGPLTRREIADSLQVSKSPMLVKAIEGLVATGQLRPEWVSSTRGRPMVRYALTNASPVLHLRYFPEHDLYSAACPDCGRRSVLSHITRARLRFFYCPFCDYWHVTTWMPAVCQCEECLAQ